MFFILCMVYPYFYLSIHTQKFYSPDETANFVFTKAFIESNKLYLEEPLNQEVGNILLPRSVNINGEKLVPQSFVGLPVILGLIGKVITIKYIVFLNPTLALIGVLLFYFLIKRIFNENIALLSSLLILFNPVYWYLGGKSMMHHSLLIFLLLDGLLILFQAKDKRSTLLYIVSAFFFGLTIWVRTSEIIWIGLLLLSFLIIFRTEIRKKDFFSFLITLTLMVTILLAINYSIYNFIFRTGYNSLESPTSFGALSLIGQVFIPFGFNVKILWFHFSEFLLKYSWLSTLPGIFGITYYAKLKKTKEQLYFLIISIICSIYLVLFYGSYWPWGQSGQPTEPQIMIGAPHLRYWLAILLFLSPFIIIFLTKVIPQIYKIKSTKLPVIIVTLFISITLLFSINQVFYDPHEGFLKIKQDIQEFSPRLDRVTEIVEKDSILVVPDWADRIFFPEFKVIQGIDDELVHSGNVYKKLPIVLNQHPVYFYSAHSEEDIQQINKIELNQLQLKLEKVTEIYKGEKLYKLIKNEN